MVYKFLNVLVVVINLDLVNVVGSSLDHDNRQSGLKMGLGKRTVGDQTKDREI